MGLSTGGTRMAKRREGGSNIGITFGEPKDKSQIAPAELKANAEALSLLALGQHRVRGELGAPPRGNDPPDRFLILVDR